MTSCICSTGRWLQLLLVFAFFEVNRNIQEDFIHRHRSQFVLNTRIRLYQGVQPPSLRISERCYSSLGENAWCFVTFRYAERDWGAAGSYGFMQHSMYAYCTYNQPSFTFLLTNMYACIRIYTRLCMRIELIFRLLGGIGSKIQGELHGTT